MSFGGLAGLAGQGRKEGSRLASIVLVIDGPIAPDDAPALCARVRRLLEESGADLVICDVGALVDPDAVTVDALARVQLTAQRLGRRVSVRSACDELQDLVALMGLSGVMRLRPGSPVESRGQAEEREQPGGVEEEADPADPPARQLDDLE